MTGQIRAVIAEDEPGSRQRIRDLLTRARDVTIVAECATGTETLAALKRYRPTVLFLDIQMPDMDGFQVLRALGSTPLPIVVFVTAHDRYALRAFDVHALDYLLKPFDDERFERAMSRVRTALRTSSALVAVQQRLGALLDATRNAAPAASATGASRLAIAHDGGVAFLPAMAVTHATGEGSYVRIHTVERTFLVRETLTSLERRLPSPPFIRIHRSTIVNADTVESLEPLTHGELRLWLTSGADLKVSRSYRAAVVPRLVHAPGATGNRGGADRV